jgi:hypothetical protein
MHSGLGPRAAPEEALPELTVPELTVPELTVAPEDDDDPLPLPTL